MLTRCKRLFWLVLSLVWLLAVQTQALAQEADAAAEGEEEAKSYVLQYFLIVLFVALALMAVCRPARRTEYQTPRK